jgi:hypothetical protein
MRTQHAPIGVRFAPSVMMRRSTYGTVLANGSLHPQGGLDCTSLGVHAVEKLFSFSVSQQRVAITGV